MASCAWPAGAQALADQLSLDKQLPVVGPRGTRDSHRCVRLEVLSGATRGVVLGVTPTVPCSLDRAVDELQPLCLDCGAGWRRQREHLPEPIIGDHRHDRLAARPTGVAVGVGVVGIGGHQPLLDREHQVVGRVESGRWHWRIAPTQSELQRMDRFTQSRWCVGLVLEAKHLYVVQQHVRFGEQGFPANLCSDFRWGDDGRGAHAEHHKRCGRFVKQPFTAFAFLTAWVVVAQVES